MSRSIHPHYTAADLYERRAARQAKRYKRSRRLIERAIRESIIEVVR